MLQALSHHLISNQLFYMLHFQRVFEGQFGMVWIFLAINVRFYNFHPIYRTKREGGRELLKCSNREAERDKEAEDLKLL